MGAASKAARLALKKQRKKQTGAGATAAKRRAAAKLAQEKAAAEATATFAALKAQEEAAPELALWRLKVGGVVGKVGTVKLPNRKRAPVRRVVNPVLQAAYERKKKALAARLGAANVNEQFLFHGTSLARSEAIISHNFSLSKVRTQSRCLCCVLVVIASLLSDSLSHRRARVRLDETLTARWEPGWAAH
jgi:hypothetical protein